MNPLRNRGNVKRRAILEKLEKYPYSFRMKDMENLVKHKALKNVRNHLKAGLKAGYSTSLQTASSGNLLSFVLFRLNDTTPALVETEKVLKLEDQRNNLVSLANKAHMLIMLNRVEAAEEAVDELEELQETPGVDYDYLLVKAKAELASSYSRFGPMFNKHAIEAFQEVLPQAREPEVWTWKLSLAITYRQALKLQHVPYLSHGKYAVTHKDTLHLLSEIIHSKPAAGEEAARINLQANAYAEMALVLRLTWDKTEEYMVCSQVQEGPMSCCKKALALDNKDANVLWKSGNIYRNNHDLPHAKTYLEKAVERQPSSAAYHHLGLTCKAMATNLQHGRRKTRRAGKREQRRKRAMANQSKRLKVDDSSVTHGGVCRESTRPGSSSQSPGTDRVRKAVKSPRDATQLDPLEPNVQEAIKHLETAVEFSEGENTRAAYDLALMHVATNNLDQALNTFGTIVERQNSDIFTPPGMLECITSQEQMALIYKKKADGEHDETKKKKLTKKFKRQLYDALSMLSEYYSTSVLRNIFGEVFQSPALLLKAAEAHDLGKVDSNKMKASILSLMNSHTQSLAALRDIPKDAQDADYYKLMIQAYARSGNYTEAVTVLSACLMPTEQYSEVMALLDEQGGQCSVFNLYLEAGREALGEGPYHATYFAAALRHAGQPADPGADGQCSDAYHSQGATVRDVDCGEPGPGKPWDIMLLYDDEDGDTQGTADRLAALLKTACGLKVVRRNENYQLGSMELGSLLTNIDNSRVVVVMPGKDPMEDDLFETCASAAAKKKSTVVLLTEGVGSQAVPLELSTPCHRLLTCPAELLTPDIPADGPYTKEFIDAVCCLFRSLANQD